MSSNEINDPFLDFDSGSIEDETQIVISVRKEGRKSITTISGFSSTFYSEEDIKKLSKILKTSFGCASTMGRVDEDENPMRPYYLTLQGDHTKRVKNFLIEKNLAKEDEIKFHGLASAH